MLAGGTVFLCLTAGNLFAEDAEAPSAELLAKAAQLDIHPREREYASRLLLARGRAALTPLIAGLRSERWIVRQTSAILLRELGDLEAENALIQAAAGDDLITAALATKSLAHLYLKLDEPALLARLSSPSSAESEDARAAHETAVLKAIAQRERCQLPDLQRAVLNKLADPRPDVRGAAAAALAVCGGAESARGLAQRCEVEADAEVQVRICRSLQRLRAKADGRTLETLCAGDHQMLALEAAAVMHAAGMAVGVERIIFWLKEGEAGVRQRAAEILAETTAAEAGAALRAACGDSVPEVRMAALKALAKIEGQAAAEIFNRLLQDADGRVRAEAAVQLYLCRLPGSLRPLWEDLRSTDVSHRVAAARALSRLKAPESVPVLSEALADNELEVASSAVEALAAIGDAQARAALFKALSDPRPPLTYLARLALHHLSGSDPGKTADEQRQWAERHLRQDARR